MPLVMNASAIEQSVRVHGSWFTFPSGQIKEMAGEKVDFLTSVRADCGFVSLPDSMADIEFRGTPEGKEILTKAKAAGTHNRVQFLEGLKQNELVSLQQEIDRKNMKYDARLEMSEGMLKNLEELATYKQKGKAEADEKLKRIKQLEAALKD